MAIAVQVVSGEKELYEGESSFVLARTVVGEIGIMPGHTPLLAQLAPSQLTIRADSGDQLFQLSGGFISVKDNRVIVLAEIDAEKAPGENAA